MSDTKEINVHVAEGVKTLEIRHGEATSIPVYHGYTLDGLSIGAAKEYLSKSAATDDHIHHSQIVYSYEGLYLNLSYNDRMRAGHVSEGDIVRGVLKLHPDLEKWQINKAAAYDHQSLAHFIKMNRHYFEDKQTAMKLVSELQNIRVKVDKEFENSDNKRGDMKVLIAQKVAQSNIPDKFILNLPVFVGTKPVKMEVEVEINPATFECELISPNLKEYIDIEAKAIIDEQLDAIRALYPQLRIFQK